jgi:hypothetical protein
MIKGFGARLPLVAVDIVKRHCLGLVLYTNLANLILYTNLPRVLTSQNFCQAMTPTLRTRVQSGTVNWDFGLSAHVNSLVRPGATCTFR